jgi:hypothetical protein
MNKDEIKKIRVEAAINSDGPGGTRSLLCLLCDALLLPDANSRNQRVAQYLSSEGFSLRQIMKLLGYKSPRSISLLIAARPSREKGEK